MRAKHPGQIVSRSWSRSVNVEPQWLHVDAPSSLGAPHEAQRITDASWGAIVGTVIVAPQRQRNLNPTGRDEASYWRLQVGQTRSLRTGRC